MSSYINRLKKNPRIKDLYYAYGSSVEFKFDGEENWRVNRELEHFSNDRVLEWEGEGKNDENIGKKIGINKKRWRIT